MMLEDFAPRAALHVAGNDNNAANTLSRLEMGKNEINVVEWEERPRPLTFANELEEWVNLMFPLNWKRRLNRTLGSHWLLTQ